jgi:predicted RNase H-like nuclease (RuvC/YqgF family)
MKINSYKIQVELEVNSESKIGKTTLNSISSTLSSYFSIPDNNLVHFPINEWLAIKSLLLLDIAVSPKIIKSFTGKHRLISNKSLDTLETISFNNKNKKSESKTNIDIHNYINFLENEKNKLSNIIKRLILENNHMKQSINDYSNRISRVTKRVKYLDYNYNIKIHNYCNNVSILQHVENLDKKQHSLEYELRDKQDEIQDLEHQISELKYELFVQGELDRQKIQYLEFMNNNLTKIPENI